MRDTCERALELIQMCSALESTGVDCQDLRKRAEQWLEEEMEGEGHRGIAASYRDSSTYALTNPPSEFHDDGDKRALYIGSLLEELVEAQNVGNRVLLEILAKLSR